MSSDKAELRRRALAAIEAMTDEEDAAIRAAIAADPDLAIIDVRMPPDLTDDGAKLAISRLGDRLRVAGTAELSGYNKDLNLVRCDALVRRTIELFPDAGERDSAQFWTGLRPATPSNVPLVGGTRYRNLFLDTGHGTLGWTHACGSGRAIADKMLSAPNAVVSASLARVPATGSGVCW